VLLKIFSSVAPYGGLLIKLFNKSKSVINNIDYKTDQQPGNEHFQIKPNYCNKIFERIFRLYQDYIGELKIAQYQNTSTPRERCFTIINYRN
jgi:hypothetical protein